MPLARDSKKTVCKMSTACILLIPTRPQIHPTPATSWRKQQLTLQMPNVTNRCRHYNINNVIRHKVAVSLINRIIHVTQTT